MARKIRPKARAFGNGAVKYVEARIAVRPLDGPGRRYDVGLQVVATIEGNYNCCDVYIAVPWDKVGDEEGWGEIWLGLQAVDGEKKTIVDSAYVRDHEGILWPQQGQQRVAHGILLSARGRYADSFQVIARPPQEIPDKSKGFAKGSLRLEAWGDDSCLPNDQQGRTLVDLYTTRARYDSNTVTLGIGATPLYAPPAAWPDSLRRFYITSFSVTTDDQTWQTVTLETVQGTTVVAKAVYIMNRNTPIVVLFQVALKGEPGYGWQVTLSGQTAAASHVANMTGFLD